MASGECGGFGRRGQQAVVPYPLEATGQHVLYEAREKGHRVEGEEPLLVAVNGIAPTQPHVTSVEIEDAFVADRDAVRVARQVVEQCGRPRGWRFRVDDPIVSVQ